MLVLLSFSQNKTSGLVAHEIVPFKKCKSQYSCLIFNKWVLFWTLNLSVTKNWCNICYADENSFIFVWTILSTTMATTDAAMI